jgi:hypothetical protein
VAGDSFVPVLATGLGGAVLPPDASITDLAPVVLEHFGVPPPASMRKAREAARA